MLFQNEARLNASLQYVIEIALVVLGNIYLIYIFNLESLSDVFQKILFCFPQKNRSHTGLEQHEWE